MKIKIMRSFFPPSDWQRLIMTRVLMFSCKVGRNVNCNFSDQYISKLEIYIPIYPVIILLSFFWPHLAACGILVPRTGIKPVPPVLEAQSLNHWTAREVPVILFLDIYSNGIVYSG